MSAASSDILDPILSGILKLLQLDIPGAGLVLKKDGQNVYSSGEFTEPSTSYPMMDYELLVGKAPEAITPDEALAVKSAVSLASTISPHIEGGRIRTGLLLKIFLEVIKNLEARSRLLNHYETITKLNQKILLAADLQSVLQIIMDMAKEATAGSGASLLLVDARTGELYFNVVSTGTKDSELREIRIPPGKGIAGSVVQSAKSELIRDVSTDARIFREVDEALNQVTKDMIVSPIIARNQVIGVIEVVNSRSAHGFLADDLEFLNNISSHTSLLIENMKNMQDLVRTNRELDRKISELNALYEIGRVLNSSLDPDELKKGLLRTLMKVMRIGSGSILTPDQDSRKLEREFALRMNDTGIEEITEKESYIAATDILLWMRQNKEPFYFANTISTEHAGLANRFRSDNKDMTENPDIWVPVMAAGNNDVLFIVSLGDTAFRRRDPVSDTLFFRGMMNQAYSAFQNVGSYRDTVLSRKKEQHIRKVFQKYVPAKVIQEVIDQSESPKPRSQNVSVLFADIQGFTRIAETLNPALLVELLNEFFEEMVGVVNGRNGIVDKFMGDSLMALFGVPNADLNDSRNALRAAFDMIRHAETLNKKRTAENRPVFEISVAVHCGPAIVGNIGSAQRQDYTAVGDTVNLASRLEKLTKIYHSSVLFSEAALRESRTDLICREVDLIQVRGRTGITRIYQLVTDEKTAHIFSGVAAFWDKALQEYRLKNFESALYGFEKINGTLGQDPLSEMYVDRCRSFIENPPPPDWEGIFRLDI